MLAYRKKTVIKFSIIFILLTLGYGWFYYHYTFARHHLGAKLVSIENTKLVFQPIRGEPLSVIAPKILIPLLKENEDYIVTIYRNKLRAPFLKEIKEAPSHNKS